MYLLGSKKISIIFYYKNINIYNFTALDIGTSYGGFLFIMLKMHMFKIYCIDVGDIKIYDLHDRHKVVNLLKKTHIKEVSYFSFHPKPQYIIIDVCFTSIQNIIKYVFSYAHSKFKVYLLIKPQFEISKSIMLKKN
jgi:predicted rRNA methylase YqxC with S4 and FtsJ domains